jgi:hypothetical protein
MALEIRGVKNVTGVVGNAVGVVAVPEKPKAAPTDSVGGKQPQDSVGRGRPTKPRRPAADSLKNQKK